MNDLTPIVECLLFASGEPLTVKTLAKTAETEEAAVINALRELRERFQRNGSGLCVLEIAGGWQMATRPEYAPAVGKLLAPNENRLSRPALETVTIIAYRQPCTQAEIEAIRGVAVDSVLKTLMDRGLVQEAGRRPSPGRPILYATTDMFLHYFGLSSLEELPTLEEEESREEMEAMTQSVLAAVGVA